jgi:two-component sensor histidine kinase
MVVHELATNSVKHGALSRDTGTLDLSGRTDEDEVHLIWSETGGPEINHVPEMAGFGSRMGNDVEVPLLEIAYGGEVIETVNDGYSLHLRTAEQGN